MDSKPIISFADAAAFRRWLLAHHADHTGIWLKLGKNGSGIVSITYPMAVDEALCFGWIDGQSMRFDEREWLVKFTKRGPRSVWSTINCGHVDRLTSEGRMQPAGLAAVAAAKADGRWEAAYAGSRNAVLPEEFFVALAKSPTAQAFYNSLNKTDQYRFYFRLATARTPEIRTKKIADFISKLERRERFK